MNGRMRNNGFFPFAEMASYQPARCTSEFVRKQLQSTIQGRQKPAGGKDIPNVPAQKSKFNNQHK